MPRAAAHMLPSGPLVVQPRRGMSRIEAATYIGVSPSLFDDMVADGRMPRAISINARRVWDLRKLDEAFDVLAPREGLDNPWGGVAP